MALETGDVYVDSLTTSGCVETLTNREIRCNSVFLLPGDCDTVNLVDHSDDCKAMAIPSTGMTLPINNPANIRVQGACGGETLNWVAV